MGLYDNIKTSESLVQQDFPSFQANPKPLNITALQTLSLPTQLPSYQEIIRQQQNQRTPEFHRDKNGNYTFTNSILTSRPRLEKPSLDTGPTREMLGVSTGPTAEQQRMLNKAKQRSGQKGDSGIMQSSATSSVLSAVSGITGSIASGLSDNDETQNAVREGVRGTIAQFGPWGAAIAAASGVVDTVGTMTGLDLSNLDQDAADRAGLGGSAKFQYAMNMLPGNSAAWGWMSKAIHGGDTIKGHISDQTKQLSGAFSGSVADVDAATKLGGKNIMFGFNKANKFIQEQNTVNEKLTRLYDETNARKMAMSTTSADIAQQTRNRYGGVSNQQFAIGKEGMKLPNLNWARETLLKFKDGGKSPEKISTDKPKRRTLEELKAYADSVNPRFIQRANDPNLTGIDFIDDEGKKAHGTHYMEVGDDGEGHYYVYPRIQEINGQLQFFKDWREAFDTALKNQNYLLFDNLEEADDFATNYKKVYPVFQKFQKGGKLGLDTNVIVEGSYHAHKNHLDEINPELSDMTLKGIPVAVTDENGEKQQIAEIERKELILTKELTDKIEALYKDGSEEAMIEAGMLFADELFNNTEDNTGEVLNE